MRALRFPVSVCVAAALTTLLAPAPAAACSCMTLDGDHPCGSLRGADAVFVGWVIAMEPIEVAYPTGDGGTRIQRQRRFRFAVEEAFGGVEHETVEVVTGRGGGDCGYDFRLGEAYLVYASHGAAGLYTGICSRTRALAGADADLRYARRVARGERPTLIFGRATHIRRDSPGETTDHQPIVDAPIRVVGPAGPVLETRTDGHGGFEVEVPAGGSYRVRGAWRGTLPPVPEKVVEVEDEGCAYVGLTASRLGVVVGMAIDGAGQVPSRSLADLHLVPAGLPEAAVADHGDRDGGYLDEDGSFHFVNVVPGEYLVVANPRGWPGPYPRIYYPGTTELDQALPVTVAAGEEVDVGVLQLPEPRREVELHGMVCHADGGLAGNVPVRLEPLAGHPSSAVTDAEGNFSFAVYEGFRYRVVVRASEDSRGEPTTVEVVATSVAEPLEIVLDAGPDG